VLVDRFVADPGNVPLRLPNGEVLRNPTDNELARCIGHG